MTIYIDSLKSYHTHHCTKWWCHMTTDGPMEELHEFANLIGLERSWFQMLPYHMHYDLSKSRRSEALRRGAVELSDRDYVKLVMKKRREWSAMPEA